MMSCILRSLGRSSSAITPTKFAGIRPTVIEVKRLCSAGAGTSGDDEKQAAPKDDQPGKNRPGTTKQQSIDMNRLHPVGHSPKTASEKQASSTASQEDKAASARQRLNNLLESVKKETVPRYSRVSERLARPGAKPRPYTYNVAPRPRDGPQPARADRQAAPQQPTGAKPRPYTYNVAPRPRDGPQPARADRQAAPQQPTGVKPRPYTYNVAPRPRDGPQPARADRQAAPQRPTVGRPPTLDEQVARAARAVASSLDGDSAQTETDLLQKLGGGQPDQTPSDRLQFSDLVTSMHVDKLDRSGDVVLGRSERVRGQLGADRASAMSQMRLKRHPDSTAALAPAIAVDLNSGQSLNLFAELKQTEPTEPTVAAGVWERIHERELQLTVTHPPANAWEEMILWTEQGKLWHLPVDNEQGLEVEAAIGFHEHVFLEHLLEPWCPPRGPIRHFMELVCVALGKNPWLSVAEKHEHIAWFRDYFADKRALLEELKAM